jgi:HTH-type transcriptional regulator/antitoxin HigA
MEQADLKPADLIPYIGSRSRVSEILSGKRQLTLEMVRALESGLGISAKVLIRKHDLNDDADFKHWDSRLVSVMASRGYFGALSKEHSSEELLKAFFAPVGPSLQIVGLMRKSHYRSSPMTDKRALAAWATHVYKKAKKIKTAKKFQHGIIDHSFIQKLLKMSLEENGPIRAQEYLKKYGVILIIEPHFPKTYLDGATILIDRDYPTIGLTLRHDRLDNFWFTLIHELAHLILHYNLGISLFYDEIEDIKAADVDSKEQEADALAEEAILPSTKWEVSPARIIPSSMAANSLARELGVHVALIAGQIRHKGNKYVYLSKVVNEAKVRKYFPHERWV